MPPKNKHFRSPCPAAHDQGKVSDPGGVFAEETAPGAGMGDDDNAGLVLRWVCDRSDDEMVVAAAALTHDRQHTGPAWTFGPETGKPDGHDQPGYRQQDGQGLRTHIGQRQLSEPGTLQTSTL